MTEEQIRLNQLSERAIHADVTDAGDSRGPAFNADVTDAGDSRGPAFNADVTDAGDSRGPAFNGCRGFSRTQRRWSQC